MSKVDQMIDAAFYEIEADRVIYHAPIDSHAVYGYLSLGNRGEDAFDVPHRNASRDLLTAIRVLGERHDLNHHPNDRVRVNDNNWMVVVQPSREISHRADEGFLGRYENGEKLYLVEPHHLPKRSDVHGGPRMWKLDPYQSVGAVHCLEVKWGEPEREVIKESIPYE